jgi:hypothetical protein
MRAVCDTSSSAALRASVWMPVVDVHGRARQDRLEHVAHLAADGAAHCHGQVWRSLVQRRAQPVRIRVGLGHQDRVQGIVGNALAQRLDAVAIVHDRVHQAAQRLACIKRRVLLCVSLLVARQCALFPLVAGSGHETCKCAGQITQNHTRFAALLGPCLGLVYPEFRQFDETSRWSACLDTRHRLIEGRICAPECPPAHAPVQTV